jgi:DNA-binding CsgD family transcriptional regulator
MITIDENLRGGTVVTLRVGPPASGPAAAAVTSSSQPRMSAPEATIPVPPAAAPRLSDRQKKILLLIAEMGAAGPTAVAKELGMSHSTAFRELQSLQHMRLLTTGTAETGKRTLTEDGVAFLSTVFKT